MTVKSFAGKLVITLMLGLLTGLAVSMIVALIGSFLIETEKIGEDAGDWIAVLALLFGSLTSSLIAVKRSDGPRIAMSLAGAGAYYLSLLCCGATLFDGIKSGVVVTGLLVFGAGLIVCLLGLKGNKKSKYKVPKLRI